MKPENKELSPGISIRSYETSDYSSVRQLLENAGLFYEPMDTPETFSEKATRQPGSIILAEYKGDVIGHVLAVEEFGPFIFRLAVKQEHRGKGLGKKLMESAEDYLKKKGHKRVNILVSAHDENLQDWYQEQLFDKGNTYVWMEKVIAP